MNETPRQSKRSAAQNVGPEPACLRSAYGIRVDWTDLPLARATVDRSADRRSTPGLVADLLALESTRIVLVHSGLVATTDSGGVPVLDLHAPASIDRHFSQTPIAPPGTQPGVQSGAQPGVPEDRWLYLGMDDSSSYLGLALEPVTSPALDAEGFGVDAGAELVASLQWSHLRRIGSGLSARDAGLATTAVALAAWHETHPRCPRCGSLTDVVQAGWVRRCPADSSEHYPRTDPAVIMAVVDDADRLLLGHSAQWPAGRMSTLAGFVEPGEAIEAAVRREVGEEVGVVVGEVSYRGSQPWPFPASLMLAFRARALSSQITVDGVEITEARWFTRAELGAASAAGEVLLPMRASIARVLIEDWMGSPLPGE